MTSSSGSTSRTGAPRPLRFTSCRLCGFAIPGRGLSRRHVRVSRARRARRSPSFWTSRSTGRRWLHCDGQPTLLFTENETNTERLFGDPNGPRYAKDAFHRHVVDGADDAVNPVETGTKGAAHYAMVIPPGGTVTFRARLNDAAPGTANASFGEAFDETFAARMREADEFYASVIPPDLSEDAKNVARQAFAGVLWSKQYYHYVVKDWLEGDPKQPAAAARAATRP